MLNLPVLERPTPVNATSTTGKRKLRWSPSALKLLDSCPSRWGFRYISGVREENTAASSKGTNAHRELELWGKIGLEPTDPLAVALRPFVPRPGVAECEVPISYSTAVDWHGRIDFACCWDGKNFCELGTTDWVVIGDFKTSSDPKKNGHTPESLTQDIAANVYSYEAFLAGASRVSCFFLYVATKDKPDVTPVWADMDPEHVRQAVQGYSETALQWQAKYYTQVEPDSLPKNRSACDMFPPDGCPYRSGLCTPENIVKVNGLLRMSNNPTGAKNVKDFDTQVAEVTGTPAPLAASKKLPPPLPPKKAPPPLPSKAAPSPVEAVVERFQNEKPFVEQGYVNPPEGPGIACANPEEAVAAFGTPEPEAVEEEIQDDLTPQSLPRLKAIAIEMGLEFNPRARTKSMLELIRAARKAGAVVSQTKPVETEFNHPAEPPPGSMAYEEPEEGHKISSSPEELTDLAASMGSFHYIPKRRELTADMKLIDFSDHLKKLAADLGCKITITFGE